MSNEIYQILIKQNISIGVYFSPANSIEKIRKWLPGAIFYKPQTGNDIGEKMGNAFNETFSSGFSRILLTGSDIPFIEIEDIITSFNFLKKRDAVIGPSVDGGYYLIGFNKSGFNGSIFSKMDWSSNKVFESTIEILKINKKSYNLIKPRIDIDTIKDVEEVFFKRKNSFKVYKKTIKFIDDLGLFK